jgi:two-component system response regulator AtoC
MASVEKKLKLPTYRILVVDDEEPIRNLISLLFSRKGHTCITAYDGLDAIHQYAQHSIEAVITDIVMPRMDGITLIKELLKKNPKLPIMVITGHGNEYSSATALNAGAREFIKKPFTIEEFSIRFYKMMYDHSSVLGIEAKKDDLIFHTRMQSTERIRSLEEEVEKLKSRLSSKYFSR